MTMAVSKRVAAAAAGAASMPLSNLQKRRVCELARQVWKRLGRPGFSDQGGFPPEIRLSESAACTIWRQDEQAKAIGAHHLTTAQNWQYPVLMAHFFRLAGDEKNAEWWIRQTCGDDRRQAAAKLRRTFNQVRSVIGNPEEYAAAIARSKYKCTIDELSSNQLWVIVFDMRRAAQRKQRKGVK